MSNYDLRSNYDFAVTYQLVLPGSGTGYTALWAQLTTAQKAQLRSGAYTCVRVDLSPQAAANMEIAAPGTATLGSGTTSVAGTLDANTGPQQLNSTQKPNETVLINNPELYVFVVAQGAGASTISCTFYLVATAGM